MRMTGNRRGGRRNRRAGKFSLESAGVMRYAGMGAATDAPFPAAAGNPVRCASAAGEELQVQHLVVQVTAERVGPAVAGHLDATGVAERDPGGTVHAVAA